MRIRTGHGRDDWADKGPGYASSSVIRGEIVTGRAAPPPLDIKYRGEPDAMKKMERAKFEKVRKAA